MPNIKSAKKRVKVIKVKTMRNQMLKTSLKTQLKKFDDCIKAGDKAAATPIFAATIKSVDQACAKGILHKNTASRKKSQISKKFAQLA